MVGYWSKVVHAVTIKQHQTLRTLSKHYLPRGECLYIYIHVEVIAKIPFLFAEYLQTFDDGHGRTPLTDSQNPANSSSALSSSLWSARSTSTNFPLFILYPLLLTPLCLLPPTSPLRPTNSFHII